MDLSVVVKNVQKKPPKEGAKFLTKEWIMEIH